MWYRAIPLKKPRVALKKGLEDTIDLNLKMYRNIEGLLIFAPNEILQEAARNKRGYCALLTSECARYRREISRGSPI